MPLQYFSTRSSHSHDCNHQPPFRCLFSLSHHRQTQLLHFHSPYHLTRSCLLKLHFNSNPASTITHKLFPPLNTTPHSSSFLLLTPAYYHSFSNQHHCSTSISPKPQHSSRTLLNPLQHHPTFAFSILIPQLPPRQTPAFTATPIAPLRPTSKSPPPRAILHCLILQHSPNSIPELTRSSHLLHHRFNHRNKSPPSLASDPHSHYTNSCHLPRFASFCATLLHTPTNTTLPVISIHLQQSTPFSSIPQPPNTLPFLLHHQFLYNSSYATPY